MQGPCLPKCGFLVGKADAFASEAELEAWLQQNLSAADGNGVSNITTRMPGSESGSAPAQLRVLVLMAERAPTRSLSDIAPLRRVAEQRPAQFTYVQTRGALRSFEEFPEDIAGYIRAWYNGEPAAK